MGTSNKHHELSLQHAVHRDTILFEARDGTYYISGESLYRFSALLKLPNHANTVGFDGVTFALYAKQLLEKGAKVGVARGNLVRILDRNRNNHRPKVDSTTIGISPAPKEVVEALLVAAYQTGRILRCKLVEPRGRRNNRRALRQRGKVAVSEPVFYGQLRLPI